MGKNSKDQGLFDGIFGIYIFPGIALQSVLIGGGYATGREIVSFGAKFGAYGYLSGIGILLGFILISILTFEVARTFKAYDYKTLIKQFVGKFWIVFDVLIFLFGILGISVMISASGEITHQILHIPYWVGVGAMVIIISILTFYGSWLIQRFQTVESALVYICYILFSAFVISKNYNNIYRVFSCADTSFITAPVTRIMAIKSGIVYVSYNIIVFSTTLFSLKKQTKRKHTVISGILAGIFMTIPWFLTYFSVMSFYPSKNVLSAPIPWLVMLKTCAPPWLIFVFAVIILWALISSAAGLIFGLLERVQVGLVDMGKERLKSKQRFIITFCFLLFAAILAKIGIIDLIAKGYSIMAYGFIAVYIVPLFTIGLIRIINPNWGKEFWDKERKM